MPFKFVLPGAEDRTVVIGPTGSGKTVAGAFILSQQRFDKRPWVCLDFKDEELWDKVGDPPMRPLKLGDMPGKTGLYRMRVNPGQEEALEAWFWKVWHHGNIGIFGDEMSLIGRSEAFRAVLRQGRSKRIPVIGCTQRPVGCDPELFSESGYRMLFGIGDEFRDYPVIRGLFGPTADVRHPLPPHWSYWYDVKQRQCMVLRPVPPPATIASDLKSRAPHSWFWRGA